MTQFTFAHSRKMNFAFYQLFFLLRLLFRFNHIKKLLFLFDWFAQIQEKIIELCFDWIRINHKKEEEEEEKYRVKNIEQLSSLIRIINDIALLVFVVADAKSSNITLYDYHCSIHARTMVIHSSWERRATIALEYINVCVAVSAYCASCKP